MIEALQRVVQRMHYPLEVIVGIEFMHMTRKGQPGGVKDQTSSPPNQFYSLAF